jgi:hypothetical protein
MVKNNSELMLGLFISLVEFFMLANGNAFFKMLADPN